MSNRSIILFLAFALGIVFGVGTEALRPITVPVLALSMTVSITQIPTRTLLTLRNHLRPVLLSILLNYIVLGGLILLLAYILNLDEQLWIGFVLLAAVPPAVAVVPYAQAFGGNTTLSLLGTIGTYVAALIITPLTAFVFIGQGLLDPRLFAITLAELVFIPIVVSRLIILSDSASQFIERWRDMLVNWSFFIVIYTVVGLNRSVFLGQFDVLAVTSIVGIACTFALGHLLEVIMRRLGTTREDVVSLTLMGTLKNFGMAAAIALAVFSVQASIPAAVATVYSVLYIVWRGVKADRKT